MVTLQMMPITLIMIILPLTLLMNTQERLTKMRLMPRDMAITTVPIGTINMPSKTPMLPGTLAITRMPQKITQTSPTPNRAIIITAIEFKAYLLPCANGSAGLFGTLSF